MTHMSAQLRLFSRRYGSNLQNDHARVIAALQAKRDRENALLCGHPPQSISNVARSIGFRSHTGLSNWWRKDMSPRAIARRASAKAWNRLLAPAEELVVVGFVLWNHLLRFATTTDMIKKYIYNRYGRKVSACWVRRWAERNSLSKRKVIHCSTAEFSLYKRQKAIELHKYILSLGLCPDRLWMIDKTHFGARGPSYQFAPLGRYHILSLLNVFPFLYLVFFLQIFKEVKFY